MQLNMRVLKRLDFPVLQIKLNIPKLEYQISLESNFTTQMAVNNVKVNGGFKYKHTEHEHEESSPKSTN